MTNQPFRPFISISVILSFGLLLNGTPPGQARPARNGSEHPQASMAFEPPPGQGMPSRTAAGGSRGTCPNAEQLGENLTALVPNLIRSEEIGPDLRGYTVEPKPVFYFYLPAAAGVEATFSLKDEDGSDVYQMSVPVPNQPGIVGVKLPEDAPALEMGKTYRWSFGMVCQSADAENVPEVVFVSGDIRRIEPDGTLAAQLTGANPVERAALYARHGIWFESLATLAALRQARPEDATLASRWEELLNSVGLDAIATQPFAE
ncbi:DUF928 domain-containing protein [Lyngbya sp. CCY1209]|jgi:hypothetical protein|uniref:DUF928 domain-containing protein n=1 Tax=Lyngbya sp. CCY1209 TaxID=2886103 RepID=UPI002D2063F5|nr:DUF928 domain-containing protein [Lyngbya sp. CCY1209]MEB3885165.1 DUF928 domain-containing protein [Lyngbya sp. CCY1209]